MRDTIVYYNVMHTMTSRLVNFMQLFLKNQFVLFFIFLL